MATADTVTPPPGFVDDLAPPEGFVEDVAPPPGFELDQSRGATAASEVSSPAGLGSTPSPATPISIPADTSFGGAIMQGIDQPLEAIGTTAQVAGFPRVGQFLQELTDTPINYESASEEFVKTLAPGLIPRAVTEQAGQLIGSIFSRITGSAIGGAIGGRFGPQGAAAGAGMGAFAGPFFFGAMQIAGPTALERAKNNGRTEPNAEDIATALTTAAASGSLDAIGTRFLPGGKEAVGGVVRRIGKAFLGESLTEGGQSLVEQTGETLATESGLKVSGQQAFAEAVLGGSAGAGITMATAPFTKGEAATKEPSRAELAQKSATELAHDLQTDAALNEIERQAESGGQAIDFIPDEEPPTITPDAERTAPEVATPSEPAPLVETPQGPLRVRDDEEAGVEAQPGEERGAAPAESVLVPETAPKSQAADIQNIVPAIRVDGQIVRGQPGETHQDILKRHFGDDLDSFQLAMADFDTKGNPNFFLSGDEEISRDQLENKFGVRDSQGLREKQIAEAKKSVPVPKLQKGQLTLVGEKKVEKAAAPPKPEPSVEDTVADAVRAYGDLAGAGEHLQSQLDALEADPKASKPAKARLKAAIRKIGSIFESQARKEAEDEAAASRGGQHELITSVKELGGLPTLTEKGKAATGELKRIMESKKGAFLALFRKGAKGLDELREALVERGFRFDTPYDMLSAIEESLASGKKQFGEGELPFGPGKMTEGELPPQSETAIKRAVVDVEREARGEEEIPTPEREPVETVVQRAEDRKDANPSDGQALVSRILNGDTRINRDEAASLLVERRRVVNDINQALDRAGQADTTPEERKLLLDQVALAEETLNRVDHATRAAGSTWSDVGHMYQQSIAEDYTLGALIRRRRAATGEAVPADQVERLRQQAKEIADLQQRLAAAETAKVDADAMEAAQAEIKRLRDELSARPTYGKAVLERAEKITQALETRADESRKALNKMLGRVSAGIDPTMLVHFANIAAAKIARFGMNQAETTAAFIAEFGDAFNPQWMQKIWDKAQKLIGTSGGKVAKQIAETSKKEKINTAAIAEGIKGAVQEGATFGGPLDMMVKMLARSLPLEQLQTLDSMLNALETILKPILPDVSRRQIMDAFSDYGKSTPAPTDALRVALSERRQEAQKLAQLQDIVEKQEAPLPTGKQRVKASDEARRLQQQINEAKKRYNIQPVDPERHLSTALETRKTYYRNRIADLRFEIDRRERTVRSQTPPPTDPELEGLKAQYEKLKAEHDEIFAKGMTDEQRLAAAIRTAERSQAEWQKRLEKARKGVFEGPAPSRPVPASTRLDAIKAQIESAKAQVESLKSLDTALQESAKEKQLLAAIERAKEAPKPPKGEPLGPESERITRLQDELDKLRAARELSPEAKEIAEERAINSLKEQIATLDKRIREGRIAPETKPGAPMTPEREALTSERDALNSLLTELRNAERPKKSKDAIALQMAISRAKAQIADMQDRLARGDFSKRPKRPPLDPARDPELNRLTAQRDALKAEVAKETEKARVASLGAASKAWYRFQQARGAVVNIRSSADFSAPRQALMAILRNFTSVRGNVANVRAARQMFTAWSNETKAQDERAKIDNRQNRTNGLDAKVEYSDIDSTSFTKREENAHSILDEWAKEPMKGFKAPLVAGARVVRMSNRAFVTFLNRMRADLFDQLVATNFQDRPPTQEEADALANYVNIATGRGKMNPTTAKIASEVLWSPKLLTSRVQALFFQPLWTAAARKNPRVQKIIAKEYARVMISGGLLYLASRLFDEDDEEKPPTSSDFAKINRGNTRIDIWGGFQQPTVLLSRYVTGKTTSLSGKEHEAGAGRKYGERGLFHVGTDFLRSKLRPDIGLAVDLATGTDYMGQPTRDSVPTAIETIVGSTLIPLPMQDIVNLMKDRGIPEGTAWWMLGLFGAGVGVYDEDAPTRPARY